jgi:tetratricopeptide (TPR) repeat protein
MILPTLALALWARAETIAFPEFTVTGAKSYLEEQSKEFAAKAGTDADTLYLLARLQNRLGDQTQAAQLARQACDRDPKRPDVYSFLGRIFLSEGRLEEAAGAFRKALELNPRAAGDDRRLGMILDQLGDHEGARKAFLAGLELTPNDALGQLMLGRSLLDHGEAKEAVDHLEKACQLDGTSINAFYVLAQAQNQSGDKAAAQRTLQTFQRLRVHDRAELMEQDAVYNNEKEMRQIAVDFHLDAASFFMRQRRIDLAEAHLKQATVVAPDDAQAYEVLARVYLTSHRELPGALALARRCATLQPTAAHYDLLADVCEVNGLDDEARQAEKEARRLDPGNSIYLEHQQRLSQKP